MKDERCSPRETQHYYRAFLGQNSLKKKRRAFPEWANWLTETTISRGK
jgi:hypothetical protein